MKRISIVVPCFNEAERMPKDGFSSFLASHSNVDFVFVNDGSSDDTLAMLEKFAATAPDRIQVLDQQPNRGKAEAVRIGMLSGFASGAHSVGYWDADLATPLAEIESMQALLDERPACQIVLGARVNMLGRRIERSPVRHYLGRIFATTASLTLGLRVYDTQTGAKLLRNCESTRRLFDESFITNWIFDVEILARFLNNRTPEERASRKLAEHDAIVELPLQEWIDVAGSKVKHTDFFLALYEMAKLYRHYFGRAGRR